VASRNPASLATGQTGEEVERGIGIGMRLGGTAARSRAAGAAEAQAPARLWLGLGNKQAWGLKRCRRKDAGSSRGGGAGWKESSSCGLQWRGRRLW
jgi:hypothetical protein